METEPTPSQISAAIEKLAVAFSEQMAKAPEYDGPQEIAPLAYFFSAVGEMVIAFSRLERWLSWATESVLRLKTDDANAIQESVNSVSTRIGLFHTVAASHAEANAPGLIELKRLVVRMRALNDFRNLIVHHPWTGMQAEVSESGKLERFAAAKERYAGLERNAEKPLPKSYSYTVEEIRQKAHDMINVSAELRAWVNSVCPDAEQRVP